MALKGFGARDLKRKQHVVKRLDTPGPRTSSENPNPAALQPGPTCFVLLQEVGSLNRLSVGPEPLCHTGLPFLFIAVEFLNKCDPSERDQCGGCLAGQFVGERVRLEQAGYRAGCPQEGWHAQLFQGKGHSMRAGQTFTLKCVPSR